MFQCLIVEDQAKAHWKIYYYTKLPLDGGTLRPVNYISFWAKLNRKVHSRSLVIGLWVKKHSYLLLYLLICLFYNVMPVLLYLPECRPELSVS